MPIEQVVRTVCDYKQAYTQFGGLRPFGVAFLFAGWDKHYGFQLYQSDPSGNYSGWKATVIGSAANLRLCRFQRLLPRSEQPGGEESPQDGLLS